MDKIFNIDFNRLMNFHLNILLDAFMKTLKKEYLL